jgi:hypothetical protein
MDGGESFCHRIGKQNGYAVGGLYSGEDVRQVGRDRVGVLVRVAGVLIVTDKSDSVAVNLPCEGEFVRFIERGEEAAAVFVDVFGRVLVKSGKVEL